MEIAKGFVELSQDELNTLNGGNNIGWMLGGYVFGKTVDWGYDSYMNMSVAPYCGYTKQNLGCHGK